MTILPIFPLPYCLLLPIHSLLGLDSPLPFPLSLTIVAGFLGTIILLAEVINRLSATGVEVTRKIVHIGAGNVILLAWGLGIPAWIAIAAAVIASLVAIISYYLPILPSINSVGRQSLGTFFYALSVGLLVGIFWPLQQPQYAVIGILVMAWGDGLAALIGQKFGTHRYSVWGSQKSWEGTLTMFLVSFTVAFGVLASVQDNMIHNSAIALVVAIAAASLETISQLGIDNLSVPLGSAMLCWWLERFLP
ncbi:MAG: SEC59/DGK1/VTE5 family protein [Jaaginema sp. PMC 1079.18]|nr:SEC59/DGK1/VTE5 family protein [Jaaginema sp. PMC 1080.18]MEC4851063.1 SEC59/DGK1/VTE5 family protein [Jaaginema sp. PMC 1079.18]MEC4866979.1 SEC59/DGK1/VTE5 family protein [Jaaginema sp. PMC 1078.18]